MLCRVKFQVCILLDERSPQDFEIPKPEQPTSQSILLSEWALERSIAALHLFFN